MWQELCDIPSMLEGTGCGGRRLRQLRQDQHLRLRATPMPALPVLKRISWNRGRSKDFIWPVWAYVLQQKRMDRLRHAGSSTPAQHSSTQSH